MLPTTIQNVTPIYNDSILTYINLVVSFKSVLIRKNQVIYTSNIINIRIFEIDFILLNFVDNRNRKKNHTLII